MLNGDNSFYMDYPDVLLKTDAQSDDFWWAVKSLNKSVWIGFKPNTQRRQPACRSRDPVAVGVGTLLEHSPFSPEYDPEKA